MMMILYQPVNKLTERGGKVDSMHTIIAMFEIDRNIVDMYVDILSSASRGEKHVLTHEAL